MNISTMTHAELADNHGTVKAQISKLQGIKKDLEGAMIDSGKTSFIGGFFKVSLSDVAEGNTPDKSKIYAQLDKEGKISSYFKNKYRKIRKAYIKFSTNALPNTEKSHAA
ncbi:MAG: hypothetical protein KAJ73_00130 [Zetaproteobacteria bacterium]|nr:hypothetical protein [Zetaproteobacteria bacterium]